MNEKNEFKFSVMRQFGSEQVTFTATIKSDKIALSDEEIKENVRQIDTLVLEAFRAVETRQLAEKDILIDSSERRTATVKKLDDQLKLEMQTGVAATATMTQAARASAKLSKNNKN